MSFKNLKNFGGVLLLRKKESEIDHGQGHLLFPLNEKNKFGCVDDLNKNKFGLIKTI